MKDENSIAAELRKTIDEEKQKFIDRNKAIFKEKLEELPKLVSRAINAGDTKVEIMSINERNRHAADLLLSWLRSNRFEYTKYEDTIFLFV